MRALPLRLPLLLVLLPLGALAQAPRVSISGANFRPLPLALTAPAAAEGVSAQAASELDATGFNASCRAGALQASAQ